GRHPVGQQEIHEHEALGGGSVRRLYCRLTSFSQSLQINLRINLDGTKMIWRSFDNLKKPPRLLYAFSFDGYSASTTAFSIQEHLTIRNWHKRKRVNRYKKVERQSRSTFFSVIKSSNKIKFKDNRYIAIT
ncbi:hypothetical protein, partial [Dysosmobacter sp.]|uniref:hypothetical protein n=1 Tax=Dysosmobacter sp. TaxID=2591382 RepID=UPI003AF13B46